MNQLTKRDAFQHDVIPKTHYFKEGLYWCKQPLHYLVLNCYEANKDFSF